MSASRHLSSLEAYEKSLSDLKACFDSSGRNSFKQKNFFTWLDLNGSDLLSREGELSVDGDQDKFFCSFKR